MKLFTLKRIADIDSGMFGVLLMEQYPFCVTGERKWLNNKPNESCIPKGEYTCKRVQSPKFGNTFEVQGVSGRDDILFHKGNNPLVDSHGCIILGSSFDLINGSLAVANSGTAFTKFMNALQGEDEFKLVIVEV